MTVEGAKLGLTNAHRYKARESGKSPPVKSFAKNGDKRSSPLARNSVALQPVLKRSQNFLHNLVSENHREKQLVTASISAKTESKKPWFVEKDCTNPLNSLYSVSMHRSQRDDLQCPAASDQAGEKPPQGIVLRLVNTVSSFLKSVLSFPAPESRPAQQPPPACIPKRKDSYDGVVPAMRQTTLEIENRMRRDLRNNEQSVEYSYQVSCNDAGRACKSSDLKKGTAADSPRPDPLVNTGHSHPSDAFTRTNTLSFSDIEILNTTKEQGAKKHASVYDFNTKTLYIISLSTGKKIELARTGSGDFGVWSAPARTSYINSISNHVATGDLTYSAFKLVEKDGVLDTQPVSNHDAPLFLPLMANSPDYILLNTEQPQKTQMCINSEWPVTPYCKSLQ